MSGKVVLIILWAIALVLVALYLGTYNMYASLLQSDSACLSDLECVLVSLNRAYPQQQPVIDMRRIGE